MGEGGEIFSHFGKWVEYFEHQKDVFEVLSRMMSARERRGCCSAGTFNFLLPYSDRLAWDIKVGLSFS